MHDRIASTVSQIGKINKITNNSQKRKQTQSQQERQKATLEKQQSVLFCFIIPEISGFFGFVHGYRFFQPNEPKQQR